MFARLWRWIWPQEPREAAVAGPPRPEPSAAQGAARDASPPALSRELFFEQLAAEHALLSGAAPSEDDERVISTLVLQVVDYLSRKRVEPPVVPALVPRVLALVNEPDIDIVELSNLVEQDLALSAKLLRVANSPAFGGSIEIKTVRKAIGHLGTEQVAQVAIGLACASTYETRAGGVAGLTSTIPSLWPRLFQHGMTTAFVALHLAERYERGQQEAAFLGGLFHDVGKVVSLRALEALAVAGELPAQIDALVVDEVLHRVHAYPGDEFFGKWTLPASLMEICAQHHQIEELPDAARIMHCVVLASSFDALLRGGATERREALGEARLSADRLALSESDLRAIYVQTRTFGERSQKMFAG